MIYGQYFRLQEIYRAGYHLILIDLGKTKITVSIHAGLLVDSPQTFNGTDIEGILTEEVTGIISMNMIFFPFIFLLNVSSWRGAVQIPSMSVPLKA